MRKSISCLTALVILAAALPLYPQSRDMARFEKAKSYFRQGIVHFNGMHYLAAVEFFRKAVAAYPDYNTAREYLARSYRLAGFRDEALAEWEFLAGNSSDTALVQIQSKIDTLRFQEQTLFSAGQGGEFVLAEERRSADMKRYRFTNPVDIAVDADKNVFITSFSSGKLVKIDPNGEGLSVFSPSFDSKLYGIDHSGGRLAVTDFQGDKVYIMNTVPRVRRSFGGTGNGEGLFHGPQGVCFDGSGNLYVVDSGNHRVQKFDDSGKFILSFGKQGEYEGQFRKPTDCTVSGNSVYVTDTGNNRVSCYDDSGNFISNITIEGSELLRGIYGVSGRLLVADEKKGLFIYDPSASRATVFSAWDGGSKGFGRLISSLTDRDGYLYCLDYQRESLYVFSPVEKRYTNLDVEIASVDLAKYPTIAYYLSVRDRTGRPVYGLKKENFAVTEDSARIRGFYTDYLRDRPVSASIVLCVDRSQKMADYHGDIPWLAEFILTKLRKNDALKVASFTLDYRTESPFDWSRRRALKAIGKKEYGRGCDIGKAIYNAVSDLVPKTSRRGVVLITEGNVDDSSFARYSEKNVIEYARAHHVPVYIVCLREADPVLRRIADATGGALLSAREVDALRLVYERIRNAEEYRYTLVYSTLKPPALKGWWSDVRIEVTIKGQKGVEWGGYFVP
jgi:DNA-binding beta-propeller fold protein YncE